VHTAVKIDTQFFPLDTVAQWNAAQMAIRRLYGQARQQFYIHRGPTRDELVATGEPFSSAPPEWGCDSVSVAVTDRTTRPTGEMIDLPPHLASQWDSVKAELLSNGASDAILVRPVWGIGAVLAQFTSERGSILAWRRVFLADEYPELHSWLAFRPV